MTAVLIQRYHMAGGENINEKSQKTQQELRSTTQKEKKNDLETKEMFVNDTRDSLRIIGMCLIVSLKY